MGFAHLSNQNVDTSSKIDLFRHVWKDNRKMFCISRKRIIWAIKQYKNEWFFRMPRLLYLAKHFVSKLSVHPLHSINMENVVLKALPPLRKIDFRQKNDFWDKHRIMFPEMSTSQIYKNMIESWRFLRSFLENCGAVWSNYYFSYNLIEVEADLFNGYLFYLKKKRKLW